MFLQMFLIESQTFGKKREGAQPQHPLNPEVVSARFHGHFSMFLRPFRHVSVAVSACLVAFLALSSCSLKISNILRIDTCGWSSNCSALFNEVSTKCSVKLLYIRYHQIAI